MHCSTITQRSLLALQLSVALVVAIPTTILNEPRDAPAVVWQNDPKGNVIVGFSDDTINLGSITIDDIMGSMYTACGSYGTCDTNPTTMTGEIITSKGNLDGETITLNPSGDYPTWLNNGILQALQAGITAAATSANMSYEVPCASYESYCPQTVDTQLQYTVPAYWSIIYQDANDCSAAPPFVTLGLTQSVDTGAGLCSDFITIGGAVAGAINGVAGGIFSLIGLACPSS
ncbi:hypothetical protein MMC25_005053 [Agyrium rufum]|nr:hypothetical protein [Agyrium rufum]